jgi:hypothetical protein
LFFLVRCIVRCIQQRQGCDKWLKSSVSGIGQDKRKEAQSGASSVQESVGFQGVQVGFGSIRELVNHLLDISQKQ